MSRQDGAAMTGRAALDDTFVASFQSEASGLPARLLTVAFLTAVTARSHAPVHRGGVVPRLSPKPASRRTIW